MDNSRLEKLKAYANANEKCMYALRDWKNLQDKPYKVVDILNCLYEFAKGKHSIVTELIQQLTEKKKRYGRTQYGAEVGETPRMDIVMDGNELKVINFNPNFIPQLKGQHLGQNKRPHLKSDGTINKHYVNTDNRLHNLGEMVREWLPKADSTVIALVMQAIRKQASQKKIHPTKVLQGLKNGKLKLKPENGRLVIESVVIEGKTVIISEGMYDMLKKDLEMSEYKFYSNIKHFLSELLSSPTTAEVPLLLKQYGMSRSQLIKLLMANHIIERSTRIHDKDENGEPTPATMKVRYMVPKRDFEHKLKRLYIKLFERNLPQEQPIEEDGATSCDASGQFVQPLFGIVKRNFNK